MTILKKATMEIPKRYCLMCFKMYFRSSKAFAIFFCLIALILLSKILNVKNQIIRIDLNVKNFRLKTTTLRSQVFLSPDRLKQIKINKKNNLSEKNKTEMKMKWWKEKIERLNKMRPRTQIRHIEVNGTVNVNYNVHIFYYAWYENEAIDGKWQHWNHEYLENWNKNDRKKYPTGRHVPPDDIGANFYPQLGCYSSKDPEVINTHMKQIKNAGIGVLIVSWYPPGMSDGSSRSPDKIFLQLLNAAKKHELKVSPHIEPYKDRNPHNFFKYLQYFRRTYGNHPALYKINRGGKDLIVYYIYDSYRIPAASWRQLFGKTSNMTVRGTLNDGIFIGLLVDVGHKQEIKMARFDGFYTYFASNGFSYGSSWKNWKTLSSFARLQNLLFISSIGPGYIDTRVRPWNSGNMRHRRKGKYYEVGWRTAILAGVDKVSITSFNEWHEGTQIEPAVPKKIQNFSYLDYEPEGPNFYLNLTKFWVNEFGKKVSNVPIF